MSYLAALTQTCNVFADMPDDLDGVASLTGRLDEVRQANIEHHVELVERAHASGAALVGMGELFAAPYFALHRHPLWHDLAEAAADGPTVSAFREVARRLSVVLVVPIFEAAPEGRFNTAVVIDAGGEVLGSYRKCHIPAGRNEAAAFDETFYYQASNGAPLPGTATSAGSPYFPVFETAVGVIGVNICYDRHFEGVVAALARAGAELVLSPAVTFGEKSRRMWELEFAVDAARHGVFIGGSNRKGSEAPWNQEFFGESHFSGPDGRLPDLSQNPHLVISEIDRARLAAPDSSGWDMERDRRPEIF